MKICSPQLGISPKSHLGGEVYDFNIVDNLCRMGHKNYVLLPKNRLYKKQKNLKVAHLPIKHIFPPHIFNILSIPFILRTKSKYDFDVLRLHNPYFLGFAGFIYKKIYPDAKIVTDILLVEDRIDLDFILKKTIHIYDHLFVLTEYLKKWLVKKYKFNPKKITVIYGGVENYLKPQKKDSTTLQKYKISSKITLLYMGLFIDRKNPLFLLDVFKQLTLKNNNLYLIFCGSGPLKEKIVEKAKEYSLSNKVLVIPPQYGQDKAKIINVCDIFMFPTKSEGFGLVAAEAMACGKPVIASNNSSLPEVVDNNKNGFLVETGNLNAWVKKTELLVENKKMRDKFSVECVKKAKNSFSWQQVAKKISVSMKAI